MIGEGVRPRITDDAVQDVRRLSPTLAKGPMRASIRRMFDESHPTARYGQWSTWRHPRRGIEFVVAENGTALIITKVRRTN